MHRELNLLRTTVEYGLPRLYNQDEGLFYDRVVERGSELIQVGRSLRYTAICLLGLKRICGLGLNLEPALERVARWPKDSVFPDDLGLMLWALAAHRHPAAGELAMELARNKQPTGRSMAAIGTMEIAWMLAGATEALRQDFADGELHGFAEQAAAELLARQGSTELFQNTGLFSRYHLPHRLLQQRIVSLASQIYPIKALADWSQYTGEPEWRNKATVCARQLVRMQGELGQWPWLYSHSHCAVTEFFPVYSVHQHAMVPMALLSLQPDAEEFRAALVQGLRWVFGDNELGAFMCEPNNGVIWRAIQPVSREHSEIVSDRVFGLPPEAWPGIYRAVLGRPKARQYQHLLVLRQMRSYELGWLAFVLEQMVQALDTTRAAPDLHVAAPAREKIMLLNLPSPPGMNVSRDFAGGFGIAGGSSRPRYGHDNGWPVIPNVPLATTAAVLREQGYPVAYCDAQAEDLATEQVHDRVKEFQPDWIFSQLNLPSLVGDLAFVRDLKRTFPTLRVGAFGPACRACTAEVLNGGGDAAILGDPEIIVPNLLNAKDNSPVAGIAQWGPAGMTTSTEAPRLGDLDSLPRPAYDLLPMERYRHAYFGWQHRFMAFQTSKGCAFGCSYCPYPYGFGDRAIYAAPEHVVEELAYLAKEHQVRAILFRDQNFTLPRRHAEAICQGMIEKRLPLSWVCETRFDCVDAKLLALMQQAGCIRIHFGLESADPALLPLAKPGLKLEQAEMALEVCRRLHIHAHVFMLVGLPNESWDSVHTTLRALRRLAPDSVQVAIVTPYPGTAYYEQAKAQGLLQTEDWRMYDGFHPVMRTANLTAAELVQAQNHLRESYTYGGAAHHLASKMKRRVLGTLSGIFKLAFRARQEGT
jgi:anaerobic magnesium-protoporphyrin IX monomethyl ester cyclase